MEPRTLQPSQPTMATLPALRGGLPILNSPAENLSLSVLADSSSQDSCAFCGWDLSFLSEYGQLNHRTLCQQERLRKKIVRERLGMTGQDQELREALGRYIEGVQRNAEELLDVLQKASPSQRGAVQPTKNNAQVATSPVPLSSSTPVPNTKEISQSTPIELRSSEGLLLAMVEHYPGGKIVVVPKVELPADNSTYSRFLKPRILT